MNPSTASKFRAEFPQAATPSNRSGPRILELDGYSTLIPERSTLVMSLLARTFHKPSTTTTELTACQSLPFPGALSGWVSRQNHGVAGSNLWELRRSSEMREPIHALPAIQARARTKRQQNSRAFSSPSLNDRRFLTHPPATPKTIPAEKPLK